MPYLTACASGTPSGVGRQGRMKMPSSLEIVKAAMAAYNDKDWEKLKEAFAPDAVYDEKGTHRRLPA
jgi:hypothetical protein